MTGLEEFQVEALTVAQVRALYAARVSEDFPEDELKPLDVIERAMAAGHYACYAAFRGKDILAYAFLVLRERLALVDYYAVTPELRGQGVGSRFLRALVSGPLRDADCALLEVEDPDRAEGEGERRTRRRRLRFYLNNGLRDTGVHAEVFGVPFVILALPVGLPLSGEEARRAYGALYRTVMPRRLYDAQVKL